MTLCRPLLSIIWMAPYLIMLLIGVGLIDCNGHRLDLGNEIPKFLGLVLDVGIAKFCQLIQKNIIKPGFGITFD